MLPSFTRLLGPVLLGVILVVPARPAIAQQPTEVETWHVPGWTFTPGVIFGALHDTNVTLLATLPTQQSATDNLFEIEPFGQLEFFGPRTTLSAGYHGALRRYLELDALNSTDHRGFLTLRHRATRRVTVFLGENYAEVPTTDLLELNGVPFQRRGARYNSLDGGFEARLSRTTDLTTRYEMTWVDFVDPETTLTGGLVNGLRTSLAHRFGERVSFGGEYEVRFADLNGGLRKQLFQDGGGVFRYRVGEATSFEAASGIAHLDDRLTGATRTGPYVRVELIHRARRATVGGEFRRSFVPSVAFGGTNQSETARGYIQMPLNHNRLYVQESATWHRTNPFDPTVLPLRSIWINSVLGYAIQRWFRIEGYHSLTHQDTRLPGGKINRHVVGIQFVVSEPMRIH